MSAERDQPLLRTLLLDSSEPASPPKGIETQDSMPRLRRPDSSDFATEPTTSSRQQPNLPSKAEWACLVVLGGPQTGSIYRLSHDLEMVIGRDPKGDLYFPDDGVSRRHARIVPVASGFVIEDLGSRNGTFIGTTRVERKELVPEDLVCIGAETVLKFRLLDSLEEQHLRRVTAAALIDSLTGLHNRRSFDERFASECAAAHRHHRPLSLLLADVDTFKAINDTHGHGTGDVVLRGLAETLRQGVRREDTAFRFGGEEFAVLARETRLEGAVLLAERLRMTVAAAPIHGLRVTISVGAAELGPALSTEQLLALADRRLYAAKRSGKNRVVAVGD